MKPREGYSEFNKSTEGLNTRSRQPVHFVLILQFMPSSVGSPISIRLGQCRFFCD